jgi:periplasmic divalent cation tolerance protein
VKALHSYSVPEVIGLPVLVGSEDYLNWVRGGVSDT